MKVSTSEIEGSQVVLDMEIESERVEKAMDRAYRRIASRVNVPGFRRGKAPRVLVERLVGRETLMNEALEILVPEVYREAVDETGIDPVDNPKLDVVSAEPLSVRATVPVRPKIELGDYRAIRQSQEPTEITEEQVDAMVETLRQSRSQWVPVEREARAGDLLTFDVKGETDAGVFLDQKGLNLTLAPERPLLAPGVVEEMLGMKAGEQKRIEATLPEDFSEKEIADKQATIEVSASEVKERQVPELDDELAHSLGEFATVEELLNAVRKELEEQSQAQARASLEESVVAAVVDQANVEPPQPWVEEQAEILRETTQARLKQEGLTYEQFLKFSNRTDEAYRDETLTLARQQVKRMLVLGAVADAEGITVDDSEVDTALEESIAGRSERPDAAERERLRRNLRSMLRERKTVAHLVEIAEGAEATAETPEEGGAEAVAETPQESGSAAEQSPAEEQV